MREHRFAPRRAVSGIVCNCILILTLVALALPGILCAGQNGDAKLAPQKEATGPRIWLAERRALRVQHTGATAGDQAVAQSLAAGSAVPLALAEGDFDGDGYEDLVVGYATPAGGAIVLHRGNPDAFAPQSDASFQAIGRGEFPSPFLPEARVFSVPVMPNFIAAGNFSGNGNIDLVVASQGGNALYVFPGDGKGNFGQPQILHFGGGVHALAAGNLNNGQGFTNIVVGISNPQESFSLLVLGETQLGLGVVANHPLSAPLSNIEFGGFGGTGQDAAFLSGGAVFILSASSGQVISVSLPVTVSAFALGSFIFDRSGGTQIAVLGTDGSVHIAARAEFDPRVYTVQEFNAIRQARLRNQTPPLVPIRHFPSNGWKIVESFPGVGSVDPSQSQVFFRTRVSSNGADDIMWLNAAMGQMAVISHPGAQPGAQTFLPGLVATRPYSGAAVHALPMRTNIDGRPGVVAIHHGEIALSTVMPIPDPTFTVNRFDDPTPASPITNACNGVANDCSMREAVLRANALAGTDTIMVPAGTYTLTLPKVSGDFTGNHGALYINDSVNIIGTVDGSGNPTSIIQAGTTAYNAGTANGVDMVMAVNEDISPITNATASLSNIILQNGHNRGTHGNDGDGGCMEFDTGSSGTATLTLTNVTLQNCDTTQGSGGGLANFNFVVATGTGQVIINNSIIQGNSVADNSGGSSTAAGGGIWVSDPSRMTMTNSKVLNNLAIQHTATTGTGSAGGLFILSKGTPGETPQTQIHSSTISGNQSAFQGGGILDTANLLIDQGTVISGNTTLQNGANGGGLFVNPAVGSVSATLSKVTITGNQSAATGGGIATGAIGAGPVTISFSRLTGNTAATTGSNLENLGSAVTATNNWWGTNTPATTIHTTAGTTTFDPFIVLTHNASPATIRINQSATLTGDMSNDNHGVAVGLANLDRIIGLPITFDNSTLGTVPQAQPETLNSSAQATATFNAGGTGGTGHADATVDQQIVTADINILEPLQITKSFSPTTVAVGASSTLTFSVNNPNGIAVDASFTDSFPSGLVVAATPGVTNTCGGTVTAIAGASSISFSNAALPIGACTITAKVVGSTDGVFNNTVTIDSTAAGTGTQSTSSASLTVIAPPTIAKVFGAATTPLNGSTSLTFTLANPNANSTLTGIAFTDSLPSGLVVATATNLNSTCSGTAAAVSGSSSASVSGASLVPGASCTISLNVTGTTAGLKNNSVQVTSANAGTGNMSNASITVVGPPAIGKAFGAANIPLNGSTSLSFTIQNNNTTTVLTGTGFTDTLPAGLVISTPNGLTGTCGGGTITSVAGAGSVSLSAASLAASSSCTFSVNVTGTTAGTKNNTTGNVTSTEGGTGGTASASVTVVAPPSIAKVFNPSSIALNATTSLNFTITNPTTNAVALSGVAFTDTLPTGLTVASASATVCGGTLTTTAPTGIALTGATIATNSPCQFSVTVTGAASGQFTNTTGNVSSTNGGTGNTATANLTVATPPSVSKSFGATSIPLNGTTSLSLTITNNNTSLALTGVSFTDNLPAGLTVAAGGSSNNCGGTVTGATSGSGSFSLSGGSLAASASCSVRLNVTGTTAGVKNNSTTASSTETGSGAAGIASITVVAPPTISKAFGASSIPLNGSTTLTVSITNPNTTLGLTGLAFTDSFPSGLSVVSSNSNTCGGTLGASAGSTGISLSGGAVGSATSCSISVNVTGTTAGVKNNTTGAVSSTEGGTGTISNTASLTAVAPASIAKAFGAANVSVGGSTSLTLMITNPNAIALSGVAVTDNFPAGLQVAATTSFSDTCGGSVTGATSGSTGIALSSGTIAANSSCAVTVNVTVTTSGSKTNVTGNVTSTEGGTGNFGSATISGGDFFLAVSPTSQTIPAGHMAVYSLTADTTSGFQGTVNLTCSGGPAGSTCTINPSSVTLTASAQLAKITVDLAVPKGASKGTFKLTFTGTSGTLSHNTTATLIIK